jgi:hypothetical protein
MWSTTVLAARTLADPSAVEGSAMQRLRDRMLKRREFVTLT